MAGRVSGRTLLVLAVVVLATVPGVVAAETRVRPTVEVPAGETVEGDLTAAAGRVIVRGTVDGDVTALSATVVVPGEVTGNVAAVGGTVNVTGRVGGNVNAIAGWTALDGDVSGNVSAIGGEFSVGRQVGGSVDAVGVVAGVADRGTVRGRFHSTALRTQIDGRVLGGAGLPDDSSPGTASALLNPSRGLADLARVGASVAGSGSVALAQSPLITVGPGNGIRVSWVDAYRFMANLLLGAVLVGVLPRFSRRVSDTVVSDPVRTWLSGFAVTILAPILLVLFGLSLFGIPLALSGIVLFVVLSWIGTVYGRFAVGLWLLAAVPRALAYAGLDVSAVENRWAGLLVGAISVGLLVRLPYLGPVLEGVVLVLGLGAVARLAYRTYRRTERGEAAEPDRTMEAEPPVETSPASEED